MRALSTAELLTIWEQGQGQRRDRQALALLNAACPELPPQRLAELSIGQRDACLLTLREWTFGPTLQSLATCPSCAERLELAFRVAEIRVAAAELPAQIEDRPENTQLSISAAGRTISFRLPTSADLLALPASLDLLTARRVLLQRCLLPASDATDPPVELWPPEIEAAIVARMAQADPQADVQLELSCPACAHQWLAPFDIISFFWAELDDWAAQLLRDVHTLALAYGWSEASILALSPWRRQQYLEMVGR